MLGFHIFLEGTLYLDDDGLDLAPFGSFLLDQQLNGLRLFALLGQLDDFFFDAAIFLPHWRQFIQLLAILLDPIGNADRLLLKSKKLFRGLFIIGEGFFIRRIQNNITNCLLSLNPLGVHLTNRQG